MSTQHSVLALWNFRILPLERKANLLRVELSKQAVMLIHSAAAKNVNACLLGM